MALSHHDLKDTFRSKLSIDEFEPKTGDVEDVVVFGMYSLEEGSAKDLYSFLNSSVYDIRDVEVSPNPDSDGYYMLFIELDRNKQVLDHIKNIVSDIENATGKLKWNASTHITDQSYPLHSDDLAQFVITDPAQYVTREEYEAQQAEEDQFVEEEEADMTQDEILEFLRDSDLSEAEFIGESHLFVSGSGHTVNLNIAGFGPAENVMKDLNINESAISANNNTLRIFNKMLGALCAVQIDENLVIYNNDTNIVLVGKPC